MSRLSAGRTKNRLRGIMIVAQLVLAGVFALAGYKEAQRFGREYGRTPWGWRPWAWALALGLSFIIGIVLLAVAERQGRSAKRVPAPVVAPTGPVYGYTILPKD